MLWLTWNTEVIFVWKTINYDMNVAVHLKRQGFTHLKQTQSSYSKLKPTTLGYTGRITILILESRKQTLQTKEPVHSDRKSQVHEIWRWQKRHGTDRYKLAELQSRNSALTPISCFYQRDCPSTFRSAFLRFDLYPVLPHTASEHKSQHKNRLQHMAECRGNLRGSPLQICLSCHETTLSTKPEGQYLRKY